MQLPEPSPNARKFMLRFCAETGGTELSKMNDWLEVGRSAQIGPDETHIAGAVEELKELGFIDPLASRETLLRPLGVRWYASIHRRGGV
jgi:hypothetical protein